MANLLIEIQKHCLPHVVHMHVACSIPAGILPTNKVLSRPAAILFEGSDKVPIALVKAQKPAAVARHGR
jgi:hypothetical protein